MNMCGRVYMAPANPELRELVKEMNRSIVSERFRQKEGELLSAEGEIFPSAILPVIALNQSKKQRVFPMKWGFSGPKGTIINARSETAAEKQIFRESWKRHRCAIPVSGYYEWEHDENKKAGLKYMLSLKGIPLFWLAGLYRLEGGIPTFVILTKPADESVAWMHDRMPVMLPKQNVPEWIHPDSNPDSIILKCLNHVQYEKAI